MLQLKGTDFQIGLKSKFYMLSMREKTTNIKPKVY